MGRISVRPSGLGRLAVACAGCEGPFRLDLWDWQGRLMRTAHAKGREDGADLPEAELDIRPGSLPGGAYLLGVRCEGRVGYRKLVLPL